MRKLIGFIILIFAVLVGNAQKKKGIVSTSTPVASPLDPSLLTNVKY
ncbi:MAG: hypothetical protein RL131_211, partial [Bacteroidota bacterium]